MVRTIGASQFSARSRASLGVFGSFSSSPGNGRLSVRLWCSIPYLTIIEQTARVYRDLFQDIFDGHAVSRTVSSRGIARST